MLNETIPSLHIVADNIPQAHYRAIKAVWGNGAAIRTQYDRKNSQGEYLDPPSRDARVLVEITNPFNQPRFPPLSFCEIGAYFAEILGAKDHNVLPMAILQKMVETRQPTSTKWPYTYHQRACAHPEISGKSIVNQVAEAIETVAETPFTRRAMISTAVPNLDPWLTEDIPCLREIQLRCLPQAEALYFCPTTSWRSRDLYKAWPDNVLAITFWLKKMMKKIRQIRKETGQTENVVFGNYTDFSMSLHLYGQDFGAIGGDKNRGLQSFFETFPDEESYLAHSLTSEISTEMIILPQLKNLLTEDQIKQWAFPTAGIRIIEDLITELEQNPNAA